MNRNHMHKFHNEEGFVLVTGLMILVVLTLLGIAATRNTSIELQIAGNDRIHKETFYQAEAGAILGTEILEQNFNCTTGFAPVTAATPYADLRGSMRAFDRRRDRTDAGSDMNAIAFWRNLDFTADNFDPTKNPGYYVGNLAEADVSYPIQNLDPDGDGDPSDDLEETTYLYIGGQTQMLPGGALQMAAGYEGKGKGAGGGGVGKIMDIYSQFRGVLNSETFILLGWRHLVGTEGDCNY